MDENRLKGESSNGDIHSINNVDRLQRQPKASRTIIIALIGAAVLAITLLTSYSTSLQSDKAKLADQLAAAEDDRNKLLEKMVVTNYVKLSDGESKNLKIRISNDGPIITTYQYILLYCLSEGCTTSPGAPVANPNSVIPAPPVAMAPGEVKEIEVGPVIDGLTYRAEVITERGNIMSTSDCVVDLAKQTCESPSEVAKNQ